MRAEAGRLHGGRVEPLVLACARVEAGLPFGQTVNGVGQHT
ncbi:MAG TPA: hypothetical protein VOB72_10105 [Candidatus Dormibacteraeota bacterium]|nr:hypothetical protein [Candidatus Dormibacteraeota bacterium]